ncbi:MAG: SGNH/GDSL hydrolase family protein [Litoreibacter sp.]|uniref:SGNH/GDSL hydrolase family protein n=1 Tax=Litoreibacter sp. TaxID=1969459 RepID=UPI0032977F7C
MAKSIHHLLFALFAIVAPASGFAQSKPDVLILGDSQISFGAGAVYLDFFDNLNRHCGSVMSKAQLSDLGKARTLALGVRSTSLHSWIARSGASKGTICDVDKKYGVNAGVYGVNGNSERKFIQIGKERGFRYCARNESAFEGAFKNPANHPKLLVLNFLGNSEKRWSESQSAADADVRKTLQQIPSDVPCVVLTTAPVFSKQTNDKRMAAQTRLERALEKAGSRCQLVKGYTSQTRNAIEGKSQYFRRNKSGKIIDPHHPSEAAIRQFMKSTGPKICEAMASVLK